MSGDRRATARPGPEPEEKRGREREGGAWPLLMVGSASGSFLNHHLHLAEQAARRRAVHVAVALRSEADRLALAGRGLIVHALPLSRASVNPLRVAGEALALRALVRDLGPCLVDAISLKCLLVAALACVGLPGRGLVGTITGLGHLFTGDSPRQRALRAATLAALRAVLPRLRHRLVFSNHDDREVFRAKGLAAGDRSPIIPVPGVDLAAFSPSPEPARGFRVVLAARMLRSKGVGEFAEAAGLVAARGGPAEFILAGDRDPENPDCLPESRLRAWAAAGVDRRGAVADMPGLLASSHVVCLPSYYREGFPRVLAEAMACGRPVITTDAPGCRDAVRLGAGLAVPGRDAGALAEAILRLRADPALRRALGAAGRRAAEAHLDREAISARMLAVFDDLEAEARLTWRG